MKNAAYFHIANFLGMCYDESVSENPRRRAQGYRIASRKEYIGTDRQLNDRPCDGNRQEKRRRDRKVARQRRGCFYG